MNEIWRDWVLLIGAGFNSVDLGFSPSDLGSFTSLAFWVHFKLTTMDLFMCSWCMTLFTLGTTVGLGLNGASFASSVYLFTSGRKYQLYCTLVQLSSNQRSIRVFVSLHELTQKGSCKQVNLILMPRNIRLYELTWEFEKQCSG